MSYSTVTTTTTGAQTLTLSKFPSEGVVSILVSGTYTGLSYTLQGTFDGTNYVPIMGVNNSTGIAVSGATANTPADDAEVSFTVPNAINLTAVRLNVTALTGATSLVVKSFGAPVAPTFTYSIATV